MATVFDLDGERAQRELDDAGARLHFGRVLDHVRAVGGRAGLRLVADFQRQLPAVESLLIEEHVGADGDTRAAERLLDDGKTSKREKVKKTKRAKAVGKNKALADKLAGGAMSEEQVDVIADASDKSDGAAAVDAELIDKVAAVPPDQAKNIVDEYLAGRATAGGVQTEHDRQRSLRRASTFRNRNKGLNVISAEGDDPTVKELWDHIQKRAHEIYLRDGGRELTTQHPRTAEQRRFDALHELICGITTHPNGTTTPDTDTRTSQSARPRIVIGLTIDHMLGLDPEAIATQIGLGHIPHSVLANYAAHADIIAALFDHNGEPLWLHRLNRHATTTQRIALTLRDRGCVLCAADHTSCDAHHTTPWNAPTKGQTNLNQLVLLCGSCHTRLHANNHTTYKDPHGTWRTRPATPNETPPPRPNNNRNKPRTNTNNQPKNTNSPRDTQPNTDRHPPPTDPSNHLNLIADQHPPAQATTSTSPPICGPNIDPPRLLWPESYGVRSRRLSASAMLIRLRITTNRRI